MGRNGMKASPLRLNQRDLARRWSMSERTLERWRWLGQGPRFLKLGGKVLYRLEDVEVFEAEQARQVTPRAQRVGSGGTRVDKDA
jgi:hypothetical protein